MQTLLSDDAFDRMIAHVEVNGMALAQIPDGVGWRSRAVVCTRSIHHPSALRREGDFTGRGGTQVPGAESAAARR